jgi:hypothetical protein
MVGYMDRVEVLGRGLGDKSGIAADLDEPRAVVGVGR